MVKQIKYAKFPRKIRQSGGGKRPDRLVVNYPAGRDAAGKMKYTRVYLGNWDDEASHIEYERLKAEWVLQNTGQEVPVPAKLPSIYRRDQAAELTVGELVERFLEDAQDRYRKHGRETGTFGRYVRNLRPLLEVYASYRVSEFGYEELKNIQTAHDRNDRLCRESVNKKIDNIRAVFRWGRENRLVPREVLADLDLVKNLRRGQCRSVDYRPIRAVPDESVTAILKHLSPTLRAMVLLQRATGWRPEEVRILRLADLDRRQTPWEYRPTSYKTERVKADAVLMVGPTARQIISDYARLSQREEFPPEEYLFRPEDSRRFYYRERYSRGKTARGEEYDIQDRDYYSRSSYARAIRVACQLAGVQPFTPYQLRHSKATEIERVEGLKGVQAALGHTNPNTSRRYVDPDSELAARIAENYG